MHLTLPEPVFTRVGKQYCETWESLAPRLVPRTTSASQSGLKQDTVDDSALPLPLPQSTRSASAEPQRPSSHLRHGSNNAGLQREASGMSARSGEEAVHGRARHGSAERQGVAQRLSVAPGTATAAAAADALEHMDAQMLDCETHLADCSIRLQSDVRCITHLIAATGQ